MIRILEDLQIKNEANTFLSRQFFQNGVGLSTFELRATLYDKLFVELKDIISFSDFKNFLTNNKLQIHHINGDKDNHNLSNLMLITNSSHQRLEDACAKYTYDKYRNIIDKIEKIDMSQEQKDKIYNKFKKDDYPKSLADEKINELVSMGKERHYVKIGRKGFPEYIRKCKYKTMSNCKSELEHLQNPSLDDILKTLLDNSIFAL